MTESKPVGTIAWTDLTVENADAIRDFYHEVVGWQVVSVDMGGYEDYALAPPGGEPVAGVCWARDSNAGLPAQWLQYVVVANLAASVDRCATLGGKVVVEPRPLAGGSFCVIEDPAGAVMALFEQPVEGGES